MKVFMSPRAETAPNDNGIGRVIHALEKHMPKYGVVFTNDKDTADIRVFHAGTATPNDKVISALHCHGLYWSDIHHHEFSRSNNVANQRIIDAARRAKIITVPSRWVAEPFKRDMRINPVVIGHGIDVDEWPAQDEHSDYILWNKNRPTDVCDPTFAWKLAERGLKVVSTFGPQGKLIPNLRVTGQIPYEAMKPIIQGAGLYLATAPETFGIGTLEALISGVPVLGFDWCGTADLVKHKITGWLCNPGDVDGLIEGAAWLREHRAEIGANARRTAMAYDWADICGMYYGLYLDATRPEPAGVSIVITNYNYGQWVGDAIRSCLWQQIPPDEIIVVDDGSTDNSLDVLASFGSKIKVIKQTNAGVAAARNAGITEARYPFIVCLDADDMLAPEFIASLRPALERDRGLGVAYCGVKFLTTDGKDSGHKAHREFDWSIQTREGIPPPTCIPSGSMFRRSMWERAGGYKQKYAPGEDTEFWTHGLALGFTAEMVTAEVLFWYRGHDGSASRTKTYVPIDDNKPWIKDKVYPMGAPAFYVPAVRSYLNPVVSVIVPVGPGHEAYINDAVESVIGQTIREWELIVINDTGAPMPEVLRQYPFIRQHITAGSIGAGAARNVGIQAAKGKFVLFLDADDWLRPDALDRMLQMFVTTSRYVFSDFYGVNFDGTFAAKRVGEYDRDLYLSKQVMHSVTALVPTSWAREVGGFDPALPGWEEYDFFMKLAVRGYCGIGVREPLFYYRLDSGTRRKKSQAMAIELNAGFKKKFGGVEMASCCGNGGSIILDAKMALGLLPRDTITAPELPNEVRLEFIGLWTGPVAFQANGRTYYGALNDLNRYVNAPREDVERLVSTGKWRVILPPDGARVAPDAPPPQPVAANEPILGMRRHNGGRG